MRWPFRRKATGARGPTEAAGSRGDADGGRAGGRMAGSQRAWATLPPLPLIVRPVAPLVAGPAPVRPPLLAGREKPVAHGVAPVGTVAGLVTAVVRVPEPAPASTPPALPAVVVRRPSRELPATVPTLVEAAPEFVGEPREPAEPHRAPGWLRFAPAWATPAEPEAPVGEPPSFLPPELRTPAPPRVEEAVRPPELPPKPTRTRRPSLGESRRLGLGAPIPKADVPGEPMVHPAVPEPPVAMPAQEPPSQEPQPIAEPPPRGEPSVPPGVPVYRATPAPPPVARQKARQKTLPRATVVPPELAHAVRARQHVDVSDVPVYRGSTVDDAAKAKGARAFAAGGAVFLPDAAGPVDRPRTRGLLAHELVHTVQQRALGGQLPPPESPLGQELEAQAQAAERYYGGEPGAPEPPPLVHAPSPVAAAEPDLTAPAQHAPIAAPQAPAPQSLPPRPLPPETRAEVGRIAEQSARHVVEEWTNPALRAGPRTTGALTGAAANAAPVVDRETRRQQLVAETLETVNYERALAGQAPLTVLDQAQQQRIERRLEREESGGAVGEDSLMPPRKQFAPNSKNAWLQGLTGHDPTHGLNVSGPTAPIGSDKSWFASKDERPFKERLLGGLGMAGFTEQFRPGNWFEPEPAKQKQQAKQPAAPVTTTRKPAETPDTGAIDLDRIDLDVLSERIYDRLRRRLRIELLVDRERAGLLTDFR